MNLLSKSELMLHGALDLFHMDAIAVLQEACIINFTLEWCDSALFISIYIILFNDAASTEFM